ncbi:MAG: Gfo/Idh/MocA family oxidoreductase [Opitutus sp.]|nr:Gfo/Idh/MocA family oxidoreductase [Opitutus sp.]
MSSQRSVGIGLIGAGAMAKAYAECLQRYTAGARLVAVGGGKRAGALAEAYGVPAVSSVDELLQKAGVDAVIIATPEMRHGEQTLLAAAAGKHVLVEKPMAPTVAECDDMIAACTRAGVQLMVVKHWRFRGVHTRARVMLADGSLGALRTIRNWTLSPRASSLATVAKKPFYLDPAGGGLLMGWAVHNLDWVRCLAGAEPRSVTATMTAAAAPLPEGELEAKITFANGVEASVRIAIDLPEDPGSDQVFRTSVVTERGALDLNGYGQLRASDGQGDKILWTQPAFDPRDPADPRRLEAYAAMLQGFIDCIRLGTPPPVSGHDGRMAVALFQAAREAAKSARPVLFA